MDKEIAERAGTWGTVPCPLPIKQNRRRVETGHHSLPAASPKFTEVDYFATLKTFSQKP
jgi:hypothetical protein